MQKRGNRRESSWKSHLNFEEKSRMNLEIEWK
jgi:hypothetical protein